MKIRANFGKMLDAQDAVRALRSLGYKGVHLDMIDKTYNEASEELIAEDTSSAIDLSALVLNMDLHSYDIDKAPLLAADPMASGVGSFREIAGSSTHLVANIEDTKADEVKSIIRDYGGII